MSFIPPGTHCLTAPDPPTQTSLEAIWDGEPVDFDTEITYICSRKQKFYDDFYQENITVLCKNGNIWETPQVWPNCVESK